MRGAGLGRALGWPTANIKTGQSIRHLPRGVFRVTVSGQALGRRRAAVCNVGRRPTVARAGRLQVEVHIPGFEGSLYGKTLCVKFLEKIREEKRFASLKALKAQVRRDIASLGQKALA